MSSGKGKTTTGKKANINQPKQVKKPVQSATKKPDPKAEQNGTSGISDFLYTGKSPEEKEEDWLQEISKLVKMKRTRPQAEKFSYVLEQLYDDLLQELCKRCGKPFEPIFRKPDENQSEPEKEIKQTPRNSPMEKELQDKLAESSSKIDDLKMLNEKLGEELKILKEDSIKQDEKCTELKKQIDKKTEENKQLNKKIPELEKKIKDSMNKQPLITPSGESDDILDLQTRISNQQQNLEQRTRQIEELSEEKRRLMDELENLKTGLRDNEITTKALRKECDRYKSELDKEAAKRTSLETENQELKQTKEELNKKISRMELTTKEQGQTDTSNKEQIHRLTGENERLKEAEKKIKQDIGKHEDNIKTLQNQINVLKAEKDELQHIVDEIKTQLEEEKNKLKKEKKNAQKTPDQKLKDLQEENEKLRDRLSQVAGAKLTAGNPAIADLGDPNRPTQLGEKFSELYDNEWTDAMEELANAGDEKSNIVTLRTIVEKSYEFGKTRAADYVKGLEQALLKISNSIQVTNDLAKYIKDHRKNTAVLVTDSLYQTFLSSHTEYNIGAAGVKNFIKKAVSLCWIMAIQDPPVILTTKLSGQFDTDRFRHYTKSGSTVDYVVWPVVFLHEGGPIICKGVAQGK